VGTFPTPDAVSAYEARYCVRCLHHDRLIGGCPVWGLHRLYQGDDALQPVLDTFIPRTEDTNHICRMFVAAEPGLDL